MSGRSEEKVSVIGWETVGRFNEKGNVDCYWWGGIKDLKIEDMMSNLEIVRGSATFVVIDGMVKVPTYMVTIGGRSQLDL